LDNILPGIAKSSFETFDLRVARINCWASSHQSCASCFRAVQRRAMRPESCVGPAR
jgi:hypothetical protein